MNDAHEGFALHRRRSPLTAPWEPIYARETDNAFILGLRLAEPHTNSRGLAHGGLVAALADNAMGLSCARRYPEPPALVTVTLNVDYLGAARLGQWLEWATTFVHAGRSTAFASLLVIADGAPCAKASATFAVR